MGEVNGKTAIFFFCTEFRIIHTVRDYSKNYRNLILQHMNAKKKKKEKNPYGQQSPHEMTWFGEKIFKILKTNT